MFWKINLLKRNTCNMEKLISCKRGFLSIFAQLGRGFKWIFHKKITQLVLLFGYNLFSSVWFDETGWRSVAPYVYPTGFLVSDLFAVSIGLQYSFVYVEGKREYLINRTKNRVFQVFTLQEKLCENVGPAQESSI